VLPYDTSAIKEIELKNPMDLPIEVISTDFDKQYIEEEEILKRLDFFQSGTGEPLFLPLRTPGAEFWPSLKEQDEKKRNVESLKEKIQSLEDELAQLNKDEKALNEPAPAEGENKDEAEPKLTQEEISEKRNTLTGQKAQLESELAKCLDDKTEVKYPPAVKEREKLNVVVIGPEKSGKTTVASYLA
jgi:hypothetical protein